MLKNIIFIILGFIIFFPPIALGATHLWSITVLELLIILVVFVHFLKYIKTGVFAYRRNILNVFFPILILYVAVQIFCNATKTPYQTFTALKAILLYSALFFVITNAINKKSEIEYLIFQITLAGFFISLLGILQNITSADKICWMVKTPNPNFFGTFINENHFACYISIASLLALGSIFSSIYKSRKISSNMTFKQISLIAINNLLNEKTLFSIFSFTIMTTALFLSKSRSGMTFFLVSVIFLTASIYSRRRHAKRFAFVVFFGLLAAYLFLNWIGLDTASSRLATIFSSQEYKGRMILYTAGVKMLSNHPILGTGLGSFSTIFPMYNFGEDIYFFRHLHNDFLQFLIEAGSLGSLLVAIPLSIFFIGAILKLLNTTDMHKYCIGFSILSAFLYLTLHSLTDFGLRINAISSLSVILLALFLLVTNLDRSGGGLDIKMITRRISILDDKIWKTVSYVLSVLIFIALSFILSKPFIADIIINNNKSENHFKAAIAIDPQNSDLYFKYCVFILTGSEKKDLSKRASYNEAESAIDNAIKINPYKTEYIVVKGQLEFLENNYEKAFSLFKEASLIEPNNPKVHLVYAYMLFLRAINESDARTKGALLKKGLIYYKIAGSLSRQTHFYSIIPTKETYDFLREQLRKEGILVE